MATASKTTETVKVPITTYREEVQVTGVTLNLTLAEARALKAVVGSISGPFGGRAENSVRKYTDAIWHALETHVGGATAQPRLVLGFSAVTWDKDPFA